MNHIRDFIEPQTIECAAIWIGRDPIRMPDGRNAKRIASGEYVMAVDGIVLDSINGEKTHKVIACFCDVAPCVPEHNHRFLAIRLSINKPEFLYL